MTPGTGANLVLLGGTKNLILDGRAGGTGNTNMWTIQNTRTASTVGPALQLANGANNNTIEYINIKSSSALSTSGAILLNAATVSNTNNIIQNCDIGANGTNYPTTGICAYATSPYFNSNISVLNNDIHDFIGAFNTATYGVVVTGTGLNTNYGDNWTISGNSFYRTVNNSLQDNSVIAINFVPSPGGTGTSANNTISNNYIGGNASARAGSAIIGTWVTAANTTNSPSFQGIQVNAKSAIVSGNVIGGIFDLMGSNQSGFAGIYVPTSASGGTINISDNTIGSTYGAGKLYFGTSSTSLALGTGSKTLTTQPGLGYQVGDIIRFTSTNFFSTNYCGYMEGAVTAYNSGTGSLTINATSYLFSGTGTGWNITLAAGIQNSGQWAMAGIWVTVSNSVIITNNTIGNLSNTHFQTFTCAGIYNTSGASTITGNTIYNLNGNFQTQTVNTFTMTNSSFNNFSCPTGIVQASVYSSAVQTISNNTIYNLFYISSTTSQYNISGIEVSGTTGVTHIMDGNLVYGFNAPTSNTKACFTGILLHSGSQWRVTNNMIDLGIRTDGSVNTGSVIINGILDAQSGANVQQMYYHNSLYVGGSGVASGTVNTYCFRRFNSNSSPKNRVDVSDNIFVNMRSNASGTGKHYSIYYDSNNNLGSGLSIENCNDFYGTGTGYVMAYCGADCGNYATLQFTAGNAGFDLNSYNLDPSFNDVISGTPDLRLQNSSPIKSAGCYLAAVPKDFFGYTRPNPPTIGAHEPSIPGVDAVYYVGTGSCGGQTNDYASLTNSGGFFEYLNSLNGSNGAVNQNMTIYISSDINESGSVGLNQWVESGAGGYTLLIAPCDATLKTLSGNLASTNGLITFNGADRVTIDGRFNATGTNMYLKFQNNNTTASSGPTILYTNNSNNCTVEYCYIEGQGQSTSRGVVTLGPGVASGTGNSNITITNNNIYGGTNWASNIIYSNGLNGTPNQNNTIANNNIYNFLVWGGGNASRAYGIRITSTGNGSNWTITGNSIYNTGVNGQDVQTALGFYPGSSSTGNTISNNWIGGSSSQCGTGGSVTSWQNSYSSYGSQADETYAIDVNSGTITITNNNITNILVSSPDFSGFYGINVGGSTVATITYNTLGTGSGGVPDASKIIECQGGSTFSYINTGAGSILGINNSSSSTSMSTYDHNEFYYLFQSGLGWGGLVQCIVHRGAGPVTITNNVINGPQATGTNIYSPNGWNSFGIRLEPTASNSGNLIEHNIIAGPYITYTSTYAIGSGNYGIRVLIGNNTVSGTIDRNVIWDMRNADYGGAGYTEGIYVYSTSGGNGNWNIYNNQVTLNNNGSSANCVGLYGIEVDLNSASTTNVQYNTVYISGTNGGAGVAGMDFSSYAFLRIPGSSGTVVGDALTLKNNIFINTRSVYTTAVTGHFAIANAGTSNYATNWNASDYNFLMVSSYGRCYLGEWGLTTQNAIANWRTASGRDANSYSATYTAGASNFGSGLLNPDINNYLFINPSSDLHISQTDGQSNQFVSNRGTPISITTDFDLESRSVTTPDIGADEFTSACNPPVISIQPINASAICQGGGPSSFSVTASGDNLTYQWQYSANGSTGWGNAANGTPAGATYTNSTTSNVSVSGITTGGTHYYRCIITGSCAPVATTNTVSVTVNPTPNITGTTPASRCDAGTVTLGAAASAGTINWYAASSGGSSLGTGTSYTTASISSTTTYYVDATASGCTTSARTAVTATVNTTPNITGTTPASRCDAGTVTLGAAASAGTINWYAASSGGSSLGTGTSFVTPSISSNTTYYVDATASGCTTSARTAVTATVNTTPNITGTTPASRCDAGTVTLGAAASAGTINWYAASSGGSSLGTGTSYTTASISSNTTYYVDATASGCTTSARTAVTATVNTTPNITGTTPASRCDAGTVTLGAAASAGTINWYAASSGGSSLGTGTSYTTASISSNTTYYVDASASGCTTSARTAVLATVNTTPNITGTTPASRCDAGTVTLGASASTGTINWYAASSGGSSLGTGTSYTTASISSNTTYYVDATASGCTTSARTAVLATVNTTPNITGTTPASRCDAGTVTLGAAASAGTINWYAASSGGSSLGTGTSYTTLSISTTTTYYIDATSNGCSSSPRTAITATVNTTPNIIGTTPASRCDAGTVTLGAAASAGTINWYAASSGGSSLGTGTSYTTLSISTTTTYYIDATSNGCSSSPRTAITATVNTTPNIIGTTPASRCDAGTVTLGAAASAGTINWYAASSGGSSLGTGISYTTLSISTTTTYYIDATSNGCSSSPRTAITATVNTTPNIIGTTPASRCDAGTVTLGAAASAGTINWYAASSGGSSLGTGISYTTLSISTTTTYYIDATSNGCSSSPRTAITATVNTTPNIIGTTPASRCDAGTVTLGAAASAGTINWYAASSGGSSLGTGISYTTLSISTSTTYYIDATTNGCTSSPRTAITATVNTTPNIIGTTPASRCDAGTVTLGAAASAGTINWYAASSGGSSLGTGISYTTLSISTTTTYYIDATSNGCTSSPRTAITATVNTTPNITGTTPASRCDAGTVTLGAAASTGTINWYAASSGGSSLGTGTSYTTLSISSTTTYYIDATTNGCISSPRTTITATVNTTPNITGTTPASRCDAGTVTLGAAASAGTINWYAASSGGSSLGTGTSYTTPSISSNTSYYVDATASGCTTSARTAVTATVNTTPNITGTTPASRCDAGTVTLGAAASAGTINWYAASSGGSSLGTGTSFTTASISSTTTYYVDASASGCTTSARTAVTATVNTTPNITGTTPASRCDAGTVTLGAAASAGTINWYAASSGGSSLGTGTSFTTASISSNTTYYVDATASGCTTATRTAVLATVNTTPNISGTTPASRCDAGTVTLGAVASAGTINWYAASSGGSSLGTGTSFTTASISSTTTYYVDATASGCTTSARTAVTATVNTTPNITGTTPASRCDAGTVTLGAAASAGTINWYAASSGGSSLGTGTSYTTASISSNTTYYVDATASGCTTSARTAVTATVNTTPNITGTTPASRCDAGTVTLGAAASAGTINWYAASSGGSSLGTGTSYTTPSISSNTTYYVDATASGCTTSARTAVTATVNTTPNITGTTPASRCDAGTVTLGASASTGTINWYAASSGGSSMGTGTSFTTPSISSTTTYYVDATASGCTTSARTAITATVNPTPNITGTTPASRCDAGTVTLGASASTGTINWYAASSGGSSLGTGTSFTTASISSNTTYYVDASASGCTTSARTAITATVNPTPNITGTTPASRCDAGTVTLGASASTGTINWYAASSGGSSLGTGTSFTTASISSNTTYYVDASASGCTTATRTAVTATVNPTPNITGTTPSTRCDAGTVTLGAAASAGTINWYAASSGGSSLGTGASYTTASISSNTTYYIDATASGCTTSSRTAVTATVNTTPNITGTTPASRCDAGTVTLGAAASAGTINWYAASSGGSSMGTGTSFTTASISSNTTYYVDATASGCTTSSRTAVTATVNTTPNITGITPASRCDAGTVTLGAAASAGTINWYAASSGGSSLGTGTSFVTPSISSNTTYYVNASASGCTTSSRTAVTATVNTTPNITGTTPASRCDAGTVTLGAAASAGTINWYAASSGGSSLGTGTSYTTASISSTTTYYIDASSNGCNSSPRTAVIATVNTTPNITGTTPASRCDVGTITLGAIASAGTINWYAASSGGSSLGTGTSYTTASISSTTTYYVDASASGCTTSARTAVTATVNTTPNITGTTPASRCDAGTVTLGAAASTGTINWYAASSGGSSLGTGTSYTTPSISSNTTYYVDATASGCTTSARTAVTATVNTTPNITGTTPASRCDAGTVTLGAAASAGTINWYAASSGGSSLGTGTSYTTPSISSNTTYYVDATASGCTTSARTAVLATVNTTPNITGTTPASRCDAGTVTLGAVASAGTINWYAASSGGSSLGTGTSFTTASISSNTTYYVDATASGCTTSARTAVTATVNTTPNITGTTPASRCDAGTVTLGATASAGTINWYASSSGGSSLGTGTSFVTPSISSNTTYWVDATVSGCTTSSRTAITVTVSNNLPVSVSAVAGANPVCSGTLVTFTATPVNGGTSPSYQWKVNGTIQGTNSPTYSYNPLNSDIVTCVLSSNATCASGSPATSSPVNMTVNNNLPVSVSAVAGANPVCSGTLVTFTATPVNGGTTPSYQWKVNGTNQGSNSPTYSYNPLNSDIVTCVVSSNATCATGSPATSSPVNMIVNSYPNITTFSGSRCEPGIVTLNATTTSGIIYWYNNLTGGISIASGISYSPNLNTSTTYYLEATNNGCTSSPRIAVTAIINSSPVVTYKTSDMIKCVRDIVLFEVIADASPLPSFQWSKAGTDIPGATRSSYQIIGAISSDAGMYNCFISNICGSTSAAISLSVNSSPFIEDIIPNQSACEGSNISFAFHASGTNLKYQWAKVGGIIAGATTSAYSINNLKLSDGNIYTCTVSNSCDSKTLQPFALTISQKPTISLSPLIQTKDPGSSLEYILSPTGTAPFTYQWLKDNEILTGKTMNPFDINSIVCSDAGVYSVIVSNTCGSTSAQAGTLLVNCGGFTLSGYVKYDDAAQKPMTNTTVYLENSSSVRIASAQTDANGFYQFLNVTADVYKLVCETTYKWGGANATDALLISKYFVKLYTFGDALKKQAADVNLDTKINSTDALLINKRFVHIINSFTAADWIFETPSVIVGSSDVQQDIKAICIGDVDGSY